MSPMDVQKAQNDTYLSKIFLSKNYFADTMNTMERKKRHSDTTAYLRKEDAYNDVLLTGGQVGEIQLKSVLSHVVGHQGIRTKRSNNKQNNNATDKIIAYIVEHHAT